MPKELEEYEIIIFCWALMSVYFMWQSI